MSTQPTLYYVLLALASTVFNRETSMGRVNLDVRGGGRTQGESIKLIALFFTFLHVLLLLIEPDEFDAELPIEMVPKVGRLSAISLDELQKELMDVAIARTFVSCIDGMISWKAQRREM